MKRNTFAFSLAAAVLAAPALAQTKWDLPSAYPGSNFHTENLAQFVADVNKTAAGKLAITLHPNASLFKAPEIKRAVQGNQAQAGEFLLVNFQNEWPVWGLDGVPFLATSYADAFKLYQASKPTLEKKLNEQNMTLLYSVAWPPQGLYARKPIESAADLKGIKWRAYSPATGRIGELVGAQPVTVQQAELSQAMATGVVEAFMTSGATGYDTKVYEHMKYFYDLQSWLPKNAVVANKRAFDALDKPTQEAVRQAAAEAEKRGWAISEKKTGEFLDALKKHGMTIAPGSAQLKADMQKVGETMTREWLEKAGAEGKAIVDAYRK
ncbi:MAG: TRAP transporter substrate-binding protein [Pseudomonadota bacterium]|nr:TRAP transporter substrate-binding protein [Pseudomonadota bacterium]